MRKIKYIGYYDTIKNYLEKRNFSLAATNKMDYIKSVMISLDFNVNIISASYTMNKCWHKGKSESLDDKSNLILFNTTPWVTKLGKLISVINTKLCLFFFLLRNTKKGETLIVYHSLAYMKLFRVIKIIKKINILLEVEEIYSDINNISSWRKRAEESFFSIADGYLFPTEILNRKVNLENKPYAIVCGTYKYEAKMSEKKNDGYIHVVYAGTFDAKKGGAISAIEATEFLSKDYHMHIIGFGNEIDTEIVINKVKEISMISEAKISYDGLLKGDDYIKFLQECDIGLSTQNPDADFNFTSFPSKVLSYLSNGLHVVSYPIDVLLQSEVNDYMNYYELHEPRSISNAIEKINIKSNTDYELVIRKLDDKFKSSFENLMNELESDGKQC